jgi:hypothetical protein
MVLLLIVALGLCASIKSFSMLSSASLREDSELLEVGSVLAMGWRL